MSDLRKQMGYLLEIPIILVVIGVALAILLPNLPVLAGKVVVIVIAILFSIGLYYIMMVPGWMPTNKERRYRPYGLYAFTVLIILASALAYVLLV